MRTKIVQRVLGRTNEEMVLECEKLLRVVRAERTIEKRKYKTIAGVKNAYIEKTKVRMFKPDPAVEERLERSIEHYKNMNLIQLRPYQEDIVRRGVEKLYAHGFVYLSMEVRTGKTLTSLSMLDRMDDVENVLFVTKKKAISSITEDMNKLCPSYALFTINYESIHKIPDIKWDAIVLDEAHSMGAFPKPSKRAKVVRDLLIKHDPLVILLSGTPTPESYSQMYHQVYGIKRNPFAEYKNFYRWCDDYVSVRQKKVNGMFINDYSHGTDRIMADMAQHMISYTQAEAGFETTIDEHTLTCPMKQSTKDMIKKLERDLVIEGKEETILADTAVKLMSKIHQLCSGTIKFESGNSMVLDTSKAEFIKQKFEGKKIGIFYKFKEEQNALKQVFGTGITTELDVFNGTGCPVIALQIVSGREGISLRKADALVYYNIDFSATSYWQSRDRMTTKDRQENHIYWVFSDGGIEWKIYEAVKKKKDYTLSHFKKDFNTKER